MYSPNHYRHDRPELAFEIIKRHDFATIISKDDSGILISHLPFLLENENSQLTAHMARANPQWKHFKPGNPITVIFQGPHAYISPAWYKPDPQNVPTWNYVAVHVTGEASIIENPAESFQSVKKQSEYYEKLKGTGWSLPVDGEKHLAGDIRAIVSFRIRIEKIDAKFKLSQRDLENRDNVITELRKMDSESQQLANWMDRINKHQ